MTRNQFLTNSTVRPVRARLFWALRHGNGVDILEALVCYCRVASAYGQRYLFARVALWLMRHRVSAPVWRQNVYTGRIEVNRWK